MISHEVPDFPQGFLLSTGRVVPPDGYVEGPLLPNFYVHPWLDVDSAGGPDLFVIVLGQCVPTTVEHQGGSAARLLETLRGGEDSFLHTLGAYAGRHAIVFGSLDDIKIVNDATAMRAIFYAAQGGVVASHALLVEQALGGRVVADDLPFKYGYPGNRTPFARTKLLTPNTYYSVTKYTVRRFWPLRKPTPLSVNAAAAEALNSATIAMQNMAEGRSVKLALTAGIDSRSVLAVALNAGIEFETYTYGDGKDTAKDRAFARDLSKRLGIPHTLVPKPINSDLLNERLNEAHYSPHHAKHVGGLMEFFGDPSAMAVTGNLLEIGRDNYAQARKAGVSAPEDAEAMANLHRRTMGSRMKKPIEDYGSERFLDIANPAFESFIEDTEYKTTMGILDPFDQFYWEHWMATWHGSAMVERDFYGIAFIPFNARRIFEVLLGVPRADRDQSAVFHRLIEMVSPDLLQMPINPPTWPPKTHD